MREEGPAALYKGFIPKVLRLAPGGGVLLLVVEFTLEVFRKGPSFLFLPRVSTHLTSPSFLFDSPRASLCLSILSLVRPVRRVGDILITHARLASAIDGSDYFLRVYINIKCYTVLGACGCRHRMKWRTVNVGLEKATRAGPLL